MLERVKGGEPVIYGGLPVATFEKLQQESSFSATATKNGWEWRYAEQVRGAGLARNTPKNECRCKAGDAPVLWLVYSAFSRCRIKR